jgi:hypothetical protein
MAHFQTNLRVIGFPSLKTGPIDNDASGLCVKSFFIFLKAKA